MSTAGVAASTLSPLHRAMSFTVFLIFGLTLFLLQVLAFNSKSRALICVFIGLPLLFSLITVLLYRSDRLNAYWQTFFSHDIAAIALTLMWLFDDLPLRWLGLDAKRPAGMALEKGLCTRICRDPHFRLLSEER
jgi:hypothetical protein